MSGKARPQARALALEAIANGDTQREAAKKARCDERTVQRWFADPPFQLELKAIQTARRAEANQLLAAEVRKSFDTLREIRDDPEADRGVRVRAATELLDRAGWVRTDRSEITLHQDDAVSDEDIDAELARIALELERGKKGHDADEDDPH